MFWKFKLIKLIIAQSIFLIFQKLNFFARKYWNKLIVKKPLTKKKKSIYWYSQSWQYQV